MTEMVGGPDDDGLREYLDGIRRFPPLTHEEEFRLARAAGAGDESARRRLVEANLMLVVSVARRFDRSGMRLVELIQAGNTGLRRAVEHYDWGKGFRFSAYATWWIRRAITDTIRGQGSGGPAPA